MTHHVKTGFACLRQAGRNIKMLKAVTIIASLFVVLILPTWGAAQNVSPELKPRIVSLKPNITQTLVDLGIGDQIVGITTFCQKPNSDAIVVADYNSVDLEKLTQLRPDIVFTSTENAQSRQFETMERMFSRVVLLDFTTFEQMKESLVRLGKELGVEERAQGLIGRISHEIGQIRLMFDSLPENEKTFVALVQHRPLIVAAGETYVGTLLEQVGLKNVFGSDRVTYPQISTEEIIKKEPAIVFDFIHDAQHETLDLKINARIITLRIEDFLAAPKSVANLVLESRGLFPDPESRSLLRGIGAKQASQLRRDSNIFFSLSLPRFVLAFLVGLALSVCGISFQSLLKNPLADPYILGISGGAALGYVAGVVVHVPVFLAPIMGFAGGLISLVIIYRLACQKGVLSVTNLLLIGIVFNAFSFALILVVNSVANFGQAHQILYLLLGAIEPLPWSRLLVAAIVVCAVSAVLCLRAGRLNVLSLGDEEAFHLGLNVNREKKIIFVLSSLLVGLTVSLCGLIGFVGLIVPHIARLLVGADNRRALPLSALLGGLLLCGCEYLAGHIFAFDTLMTRLPVGAVTALVGAPVFVWLVKGRGRGSGFRGEG